jgi:hypothetical protein
LRLDGVFIAAKSMQLAYNPQPCHLTMQKKYHLHKRFGQKSL